MDWQTHLTLWNIGIIAITTSRLQSSLFITAIDWAKSAILHCIVGVCSYQSHLKVDQVTVDQLPTVQTHHGAGAFISATNTMPDHGGWPRVLRLVSTHSWTILCALVFSLVIFALTKAYK